MDGADWRVPSTRVLPSDISIERHSQTGTRAMRPGDAGDDRRDVVQGDAAPEIVVEAVERNWRATARAFGLAPTTVIRDDAELFWYVTGLPTAAFNSIMHANL